MAPFNSQGSWEKRIIERVHNSRKRAASDCDDPTDTSTPKAKRERPKMQSVLNRYPSLTLHEDPDGTSQDALDKQLERPTPKKESVLPLQRKTFAVRRRFIVRIGDHVSNLSPPEVQSPFCAFCCKCMHHH